MKVAINCVCTLTEPDPHNSRLLRCTFVAHANKSEARTATLFASFAGSVAQDLKVGSLATLTIESPDSPAEPMTLPAATTTAPTNTDPAAKS
ncbi:MAG: hypothetical protein P4L84_16035 [Isosphaeraceae bacterium]|nr:hypothetical protein [Isosphaeraceae bacterium]